MRALHMVPLEQVPYAAMNQPQLQQDVHFISFNLIGESQRGIPLSVARNSRVLQQLQERDAEMPTDGRAKGSIRIQPVGYAPFSQQKHMRRQAGGRHVAINRAKAVELVADVVEAFIRQAQQRISVPEGALRFGDGYIDINKIILLGLRRVSPASFQPELAILP